MIRLTASQTKDNIFGWDDSSLAVIHPYSLFHVFRSKCFFIESYFSGDIKGVLLFSCTNRIDIGTQKRLINGNLSFRK